MPYAFPKKWAKVGETWREFRRRCKKLTRRARWYAKRRAKKQKNQGSQHHEK